MPSTAPLMTATMKPSKSLYKSGLGKRSTYKWSLRLELTSWDRLLELLCLALLPVSIALYATSITSQDFVISSGDGQSVASASLGYSQICVAGVDSNGAVSPQDCAHIDSSCNFAFSPVTLAIMSAGYNGVVDTSLSRCPEFNAYHAFHVIGIMLAGIGLLLMLLLYLLPGERQQSLMKRVRIWTFVVTFFAGVAGVIAQCLFIDWWNSTQQNLVTLGYGSEQSGGGSTPSYVTLRHSLFDLVGGCVCAMCSSLFFVWTIQSSTK